jgi:hypothetical protein
VPAQGPASSGERACSDFEDDSVQARRNDITRRSLFSLSTLSSQHAPDD